MCVCAACVCVCAGLRPGHRARSLGLGTRVWPSAAPPQGGQVVYGSAGSTPAVNFASWSGPQTILFFPSSRCGRPVPAGRGTKASLAEARGHRMLDCLPGHSGDATEADTQVARPAAGASARGFAGGEGAGGSGGWGRPGGADDGSTSSSALRRESRRTARWPTRGCGVVSARGTARALPLEGPRARPSGQLLGRQ